MLQGPRAKNPRRTSLGGWLCAQAMLELLLHGADEFAESGKHGRGGQTGR